MNNLQFAQDSLARTIHILPVVEGEPYEPKAMGLCLEAHDRPAVVQ